MPEPRGMYDMTEWTPIDCAESDRIRAEHAVTVASSLTDPDGNYSSGVVFTEWWTNDAPLLRDYRWTDPDKTCGHYTSHHPRNAETTESEGNR